MAASFGGCYIIARPYRLVLLLWLFVPVASVAATNSTSIYTQRPDDPRALLLDPTLGDGKTDCTAALQQTIDTLQKTRHHGIVLVPEGRYRLSGTVYVWTGIRLLGFGAHRPVFLLPDHTPGFEASQTSHYLFYFAFEKPQNGEPAPDGTSDTFYSGMSNIDFEVGSGDPSAVGIRFHVAQHGILSHMEMHMGSARAALQDVGNQASDLHIEGGDYAIMTGKTSPGWQFLLMDSVLERQRKAAIQTHEAGMTLVRVHIRDVPVGIEAPDGEVEQLYIRDSSFTSITNAALRPGDDRNVRSQISADHVVCTGVRRFLSKSAAAAELAPKPNSYVMDRFRLGLQIATDGRAGAIKLEHAEHAGTSTDVPSDIPALPPMQQWTNVRSVGALGDGVHDDTAALSRAIATHSTLYFPAGKYRLTGTLHLRPDTVLIGLHPFVTQLILADRTPEFAGEGEMVPVIASSQGGTNIVTGIGISTGTVNPRASGILWRAGASSMIEDVKFIGGRGTLGDDGQPLRIYPEPAVTQRSDAWNTQHPSLIIRDGGGGILRAIWSASTFARAGLVIENTTTRGRVYQFSCEHHMQHEVQVRNAANWQFLALQTEEEKLEGASAIALEIDSSHALLFGNLFMYRVSRSNGPAPYAAVLDVDTEADFANVHTMAGGRYAFDNSILDKKSGVAVRARDFTTLSFRGGFTQPKPFPLPAVFAPDARPYRLAEGFTDITGLIPVGATALVFTDASTHRVLRWSAANVAVETISLPTAVTPVVLAAAAPETLILLDASGAAMRFDPSTGKVDALPATPPGFALPLFPVGGHTGLHSLQPLFHASTGFLATPGSAVLPHPNDVRPLLYASQFAILHPGVPQLIAAEDDARIVQLTLPATGEPNVAPFADCRGTSVVQDADGNIYIAGDQLHVYNSTGHLIGIVEFPTRPTTLAFTGPDRRTLLVGARSTLYSLRTISPGRTQ